MSKKYRDLPQLIDTYESYYDSLKEWEKDNENNPTIVDQKIKVSAELRLLKISIKRLKQLKQ